MLSRRTLGALMVCAAVALAACASKQPKPVETKAELTASADVNPFRRSCCSRLIIVRRRARRTPPVRATAGGQREACHDDQARRYCVAPEPAKPGFSHSCSPLNLLTTDEMRRPLLTPRVI